MGGIAYVPKHEHEAMKAEIARLRGTLRKIAMQMKSDELGDDDGDDFEGAYDAMIEEAREALADEQDVNK